MKIGCKCSATLSDSTDRLSHKARLTPDQDLYGAWEGIDDEVIDRVASGGFAGQRRDRRRPAKRPDLALRRLRQPPRPLERLRRPGRRRRVRGGAGRGRGLEIFGGPKRPLAIFFGRRSVVRSWDGGSRGPRMIAFPERQGLT